MADNKDYMAEIERAESSASAICPDTSEPLAGDWQSGLVSYRDKNASRQCNYSLILANDSNLRGRFRLDTFKHQITLEGEYPFGSYEKPTVVDDIIFTKLLSYLGTEYGIDNGKMTRRALREAASANSYDSLREMLDGLAWDGTPRIETMFSILLGAEDGEYTREAASLLMHGAVCRAYASDGVQFDLMPVLVGEQGCRKTSFCRSIALNPEYFEDNLGDLGKPDAARKLQGTLVVEMAELASIRGTRLQESVRGFISRIYDSYRLLYLEDVVRLPRRCVFIGTTNDYEFLSGSFWDRRYLPIECGIYETSFDWLDDEGVRYFFEQLWAEAIAWYKSNPDEAAKTLTPTPAILAENKRQQDRFRAEDPWSAPVAQYLQEHEDREVCARELLVEALRIQEHGHKADQANIKKIHDLMRNQFPDWIRVNGSKRLGEWGPQNIHYIHRADADGQGEA